MATVIARRPGCKPLIFTRSNPPDSKSRGAGRDLEAEHGRHRHQGAVFSQKWPDLIEMSRTGKLQSWGWGWISSGPGGSGLPSLLVSRNINAINDMQFKDAEYDRLYDLAEATPIGPRRGDLRNPVAHRRRLFGARLRLSHLRQRRFAPVAENYLRHPFWRTRGSTSTSMSRKAALAPPGEQAALTRTGGGKPAAIDRAWRGNAFRHNARFAVFRAPLTMKGHPRHCSPWRHPRPQAARPVQTTDMSRPSASPFRWT